MQLKQLFLPILSILMLTPVLWACEQTNDYPPLVNKEFDTDEIYNIAIAMRNTVCNTQ